MKRRKYDRKFKQMGVELSNNRKKIISLASETDTWSQLIYRLRRLSEIHYGTSFPVGGNKINSIKIKFSFVRN
jgi:hypothetical protein